MKNIACIIALMLLPLSVHADDATKIDVIDKKVDTVIEKQQRIYDKVESDPLQGKNMGWSCTCFVF